MIERKKKSNETIEEYFHEKVGLVRKAQISDENIIDFVIGGLNNDTMIQASSMSTFINLTLLL